MIFKSPYVNKDINIPDEKLPDAPRFAMKCPFTGKRMVFEKTDAGFSVTAGEPVDAPVAAPAPKPEPEKPELNLPQVEPDIHPPGTKVAFLYLEGGWTSAASGFFEEKGFAVSSASDELEAIAKLRLNNYDVIVSECDNTSELLRKEVSSWNGGKRRSVNFILVGDGRSNDPQLAFVNGANSYFAQSDNASAGDLLDGALTGYELHYQLLETAQSKV